MLLLLLTALSGIIISVGTLSLQYLLGNNDHQGEIIRLSENPEFELIWRSGQKMNETEPIDSPESMNFSINIPNLKEKDLLNIKTYGNGKMLVEKNCLKDGENTAAAGTINCTAEIPYDYRVNQKYEIIATLVLDEKEYKSNNIYITRNWKNYEGQFWDYFWSFGLTTIMTYIFIIMPVMIWIYRTSTRTKYREEYKGEYSLRTLLMPIGGKRSFAQNIHAVILSPYFWIMELLGISLIVIYLMITAEIWISSAAFAAFLLSGAVAFAVPFLWCAALWYADFKAREPLRFISTLFFWGMLAALMAIGINTLGIGALDAIGFGVLGSMLIAPVVEEFFKGIGVVLLSNHHEFDSVENGMLFGFVVGMGFSFIEDWLYMLASPMGANISGWLGIWFLRSILFSANHGFYTAVVGGTIGYLKERKFAVPAAGLVLALPVAVLFHTMHNSGPTLMQWFGIGGLVVYCCILVPLFDYGGLIVLLALFARAILRKKSREKPKHKKKR